jgi:RNA polymerase primary sigma factor
VKYQDYLDAKNIRTYLDRIAKFPTFTPDEEKVLGRRIRRGDREAIHRLVEANLRFVVSYVKKYRGMGLSLQDLINEGNLGLIEAARRFDPRRNVKFISYGVWWIRQAVIHALTQASRVTHVPQKLSDQILSMKRKAVQLKNTLGREPTREETALAMNLPIASVEDMELLAEKEVSLSERFDEDDMGMEEKIRDPISPSVEYQIIKSSIEQQIRDTLAELDEKEAVVLKLRFGLDDDQPRTLQEIGDRLKLTRERIRQIEQKAMNKLAQSRTLQLLRGYLN